MQHYGCVTGSHIDAISHRYGYTKMRIQEMTLFNTPESQDEITRWIELHPPEDRTAMFVVMGMTWNFLAKKVNEETNDE